jgi:hypothetical protein
VCSLSTCLDKGRRPADPLAAPHASPFCSHAPPSLNPPPFTDLYRTFSPSEVAFWDLKSAADGSGSGFFSRLFGGSAGAAGAGAGTTSK